MNKMIGITCAAALATVCGGIGLSLANTSSDSRWDLPARATTVAPNGYGPVNFAQPKKIERSVPSTRVARLSDPAETTVIDDAPAADANTWSIETPALAPVIAARPKAREAAKVASIGPVPLPLPEAAAAPTPSVRKAQAPRARQVTRAPVRHTRRSANPQPDFLIGVYR